MKDLEGHTSGSSPPIAHAAVNHIKGLTISWGNCRGGNILLTPSKFSFPSMTLPNMLSMWFCGDISETVPPYRILWSKYVNQVKGGKQKLSNMKTFVKNVMREAVIENRNDLVVNCWSPRKVVDLYGGVKHLFAFPFLTYEKEDAMRKYRGRSISIF